MKKSQQTRENLLQSARDAFWSKGYSNVSLREIANGAGVDVALVARYFGSKLGLFETALEAGLDWPELFAEGADPVAVVVAKYANPATDAVELSAMQMIMNNVTDPEVGDLVRERMWDKLIAPLQKRMGGAGAAPNVALFLATVLGMSMTRLCLRAPALAQAAPADYDAMFRHMIDAALSFRPTQG